MLFNSRSISLILAIVIAIFTTTTISFFLDESNANLLIVLATSFGTSFFICFATIEVLIFKEIRRLYLVFKRLKGSELSIKANDINSYQNMGQEVIAFVNTKQQEIENLKKLQSFRKEFLADISHELKTPVFAAQGFVHTLLDGAVDDEAVRYKFLRKAANSLDSLDNLVNDLVAISQMESGEVKMELLSFDVVQTIRSVFDMLEEKSKSQGVSLTLICKEEKLFIYADQFRIGQVLKNLVDNAIKYGSDNGGEIRVLVKELDEDVKIEVSDKGNGIPKEHLASIFQRFYRVEKSRSKEKGGTGLGLSIVRYIVEAHASKITVNSNVKKGTTFTFKLTKGADNEV